MGRQGPPRRRASRAYPDDPAERRAAKRTDDEANLVELLVAMSTSNGQGLSCQEQATALLNGLYGEIHD